jgi:hypothetical protein
MNRFGNISTTSKFGKRRIIQDIEQTSTIQLNNLNVTSINGISLSDSSIQNDQQTTDINDNTTDISNLENRILLLENQIKIIFDWANRLIE